MEVIVTSMIAIVGTLLGSAATYLIQHRTAVQQNDFARTERLHQERVSAFAGFGGSLASYRNVRLARWNAAQRRNELDLAEVRQTGYATRTVVLESMFRLQLLTTSQRLIDRADAALAAVDAIEEDLSEVEYTAARVSSRDAMFAFVEEAREHTGAR